MKIVLTCEFFKHNDSPGLYVYIPTSSCHIQPKKKTIHFGDSFFVKEFIFINNDVRNAN